MVVVASSKLRLNPGEAVIDPAVTGVAWGHQDNRRQDL